MKVQQYIIVTINRLPKGYVFTYLDFITEVINKEAVIKSLNRLTKIGKITKLSKGKYYKPEKTDFGNLVPNQYQIVKDLIERNGKTIGYITGLGIYNQLGLTTQVSNTIQIGCNQIRPNFKREIFTISYIRQKNIINIKNIPLLQILDAIRFIKKIPDTTIEQSVKRLLSLLKELSELEKLNLVRLALKYNPATRALLGALLEELGCINITDKIFKSLNPITKYKFIDAKKVLSNTEKWNIV